MLWIVAANSLDQYKIDFNPRSQGNEISRAGGFNLL